MKNYNDLIVELRNFFQQRDFIEVQVQHKLSILAACEDPSTVAIFNYDGNDWPLPQTGQMWLEQMLLDNPTEHGFFCLTTSYRQEQNPIPGRHDSIFPMFEFEMHGGIDNLIKLELNLCDQLGFGGGPLINYEQAVKKYNASLIEAEQEEMLYHDYGDVVLLTNFPFRTAPFWNMKVINGYASKVDVILKGVETVGSAERSTDRNQMVEMFHTINDGIYAKMLFDKFTSERVLAELDKFVSQDFFTRCGGGIGLTRLARAMEISL